MSGRAFQADISDAIQRARRWKTTVRKYVHDDDDHTMRRREHHVPPAVSHVTTFVGSGSNALRGNDALAADRSTDAYLESTDKLFRFVLSAKNAEMALYAHSLKLWAMAVPEESSGSLQLRVKQGLTLSGDLGVTLWSTGRPADFVRLNNDGSLLLYDSESRVVTTVLSRRTSSYLQAGDTLSQGQGLTDGRVVVFLMGTSLTWLHGGDVRAVPLDAPVSSKGVSLKLVRDDSYRLILDYEGGAQQGHTFRVLATVESPSDVALTVVDGETLGIRDEHGRVLWSMRPGAPDPHGDPPAATERPTAALWSGCECDARVQRRIGYIDDNAVVYTRPCAPKENECRVVTHSRLGYAWGMCTKGDDETLCLRDGDRRRSVALDVRPSGDGKYALYINTNAKYLLPDVASRSVVFTDDDARLGNFVHAWTLEYSDRTSDGTSTSALIKHQASTGETMYLGYDPERDVLTLDDRLENVATWRL